jgi:hypothetical protein
LHGIFWSSATVAPVDHASELGFRSNLFKKVCGQAFFRKGCGQAFFKKGYVAIRVIYKEEGA